MSAKNDRDLTASITHKAEKLYATSPTRMKQFAAILERLMRQKNWNQSDLARHAGIGRDSVSQYLNGRSFPSPHNIQKIADCFLMDAKDLYPTGPNVSSGPVKLDYDQIPSFMMMADAEGDKRYVWLVINQRVTFDVASSIAELLNKKDE